MWWSRYTILAFCISPFSLWVCSKRFFFIYKKGQNILVYCWNLTGHAWESGPDLAPQKMKLFQKFRHLLRCKKYLKKIFLPCLVCLHFWTKFKMAARGPKRVAGQVFWYFLLPKIFLPLQFIKVKIEGVSKCLMIFLFTFVTVNQQTAGLEKKILLSGTMG